MVTSMMAKVSLAFLAMCQLATRTEAQWDAGAQDLSYHEAFDMINSKMVWPCENAGRGQIDSPFGPRVYSTGRDDFHRGVDIEAAIPGVDEKIFAVYDGVVERRGTWSGGGNYVIIKHNWDDPISGVKHTARLFPGSLRTDKWYSLYLHMRDNDRPSVDTVIKAGDYIGMMGDSGAAGSVHLHYEVRIGTRCSYSYALSNPSSTCNLMNYDPHINSLIALPKLDNPDYQRPRIDQIKELSPTTDGKFFMRYHDDNPILNRLLFEQVALDGTVRDTHVLDFDTREGYDASSTAALDTWDKDKPWFDPERSHYYMDYVDYVLIVPYKYICKKYAGDLYRMTLESTWGTDTTKWVFWFGESADEWDTTAQHTFFCSGA